MTGAPQPAGPMAEIVLRGAVLMVVLRVTVRAIGLVSVMVTARLLTPADFGMIGTAAIVTGLFAVLQTIGIGEAIVRLRSLEPGHVDTAWTLNLITGVLVAMAIWSTAPLAARLLEEPDIAGVLRWLALTPLLNALASPGTYTFVRDFAFRREFLIRVAQKIVMAASVLTMAFIMRDYWGLVWGSLIGTALGVAFSYAMCPTLPRLTLARSADFLGFSFWSLLTALGSYVAHVADEVAVRRIVTTQVFGLYHVSRDLSRTLVSELVAPMASALLAGLARMQDDPARLLRATREAVGAGAILACGAGVGVAATAQEITGLLLGPQWDGAAEFLALTAIGVAAQTLAGLHRSVLAAVNRQDLSALLWALRAGALVAGCTAAGALVGARGVAASFTAISIAMTLLDYVVIFRRLGDVRAAGQILLRPAIAGAAMFALLGLALPPVAPLWLSAALKVPLGALCYAGVVLGLWWAMGRPAGPETALLLRLPGGLGARLMAAPPPAAP